MNPETQRLDDIVVMDALRDRRDYVVYLMEKYPLLNFNLTLAHLNAAIARRIPVVRETWRADVRHFIQFSTTWPP